MLLMPRICTGEETRGRRCWAFGGDCTIWARFGDGDGDGEAGGDKDNLPSPLETRRIENALANAASFNSWKASRVEPEGLLDIFLPCHAQGSRERITMKLSSLRGCVSLVACGRAMKFINCWLTQTLVDTIRRAGPNVHQKCQKIQ